MVQNQLFFTSQSSLYIYFFNILISETFPGTHACPVAHVQGDQWHYAFSAGQTVAAIHPQGLDLGTVTFWTDDRTSVQEVDSQFFLPRHFSVSCAGGKDCPADGVLPRSVRLRLFLADAELDALNAATGANWQPADLSIATYNGLANDCDLSNNPAPGYNGHIPASQQQSADWWAGFSVTFEVNTLREFALSGSLREVLPAQLTLWPNPGCETLNISAPCAEITRVSIYDLTGREVYADAGQSKMVLDASQIRAGVYLVQVQTPCGNSLARWVKY